MKLFGFEIKRPREEIIDQLPSFVPQQTDESFSAISATTQAYGTYVDLDGNAKSESELILKYRDMSQTPECDEAIENVINDAIVYSRDDKIVEMVMDDVPDMSDNIKKIFNDEFQYCLDLLNFNSTAHEIFKNWYIDARIYYHAVIDETNPQAGIQELRYIDPTKLRKMRETSQSKTLSDGMQSQRLKPPVYTEYYVYSPAGFNSSESKKGIKVAKDSIAYATSGIRDKTNTMLLSYLHKAIRPLNQLRYMEDATIIYRMTRAPQRRVWYIDTGNLPKQKADQYLRDTMNRQKNKVVYDQSSGEIRDDRKFTTMLEDYYLPRREGSRGTEVTTLASDASLLNMDQVTYFQQKLYDSLNVPRSRLDTSNPFTIGKATEITRDEVKFYKFISKLRMRFSSLFLSIMEKQLILKNIITYDEWAKIKNKIRFDYNSDNHFTELKDLDMLNTRIQTLAAIDPYVGTYYSKLTVQKTILGMTDEEIKTIEAEIKAGKDVPVIITQQEITNNQQVAMQKEMDAHQMELQKDLASHEAKVAPKPKPASK